MNVLDQATLVCGHVLKDVKTAGFVCNTLSGWAVGCSEECLDRSGPNSLGMICLGHLTNIGTLPQWFYETPANFAFTKSEDRWQLNYYDCDVQEDRLELPEFSVVAAPNESSIRALHAHAEVTTIMLPDKTFAVLNFEETGFRSVTFWTSPELPAEMSEKLNGTETITTVPLKRVRDFALQNTIHLLLANHLVAGPSFALLADEVNPT